MSDTMVDAIALSSLSGHMSKRTRKAAMSRLAVKLFGERPHVAPPTKEREMPNMDGFEIGQTVIARFTNSNRVIEFRGRIVGVTLNYWKIESLEDGVQGWPAGKVFHVSTLRDRKYSANNSIVREVQP